jgi:PAS domain-containing protein
MLDLTSETELEAGVRDLMERYSEMLENESDWIEILNKEFRNEFLHRYFLDPYQRRLCYQGKCEYRYGRQHGICDWQTLFLLV